MSNSHNDPDFKSKLHLYRTAFSWQHYNFVGIKKIIPLDNGMKMLECEVAGKQGTFKFFPHELINFVM